MSEKPDENRRKLLGIFGIAAVASLAYPSSRCIMSLADEGQGNTATQKLMTEYGVPDIETATSLLERVRHESGLYSVGGAWTGPLGRAFANKHVWPKEIRNTFKVRSANIGVGGIPAGATAICAMAIDAIMQEHPLTNPDTLIKEYGMPPAKARKFSTEYMKRLSTNNSMISGQVASAIHEFILDPPPDDTDNSKNDDDNDNGPWGKRPHPRSLGIRGILRVINH